MIHLNEQTGAFDPEALDILGSAMDEAWRRVKLTHLNGSANAARSVLAEHIFAMARQGERNPQRLIEGALISAHTLSHRTVKSISKPPACGAISPTVAHLASRTRRAFCYGRGAGGLRRSATDPARSCPRSARR